MLDLLGVGLFGRDGRSHDRIVGALVAARRRIVAALDHLPVADDGRIGRYLTWHCANKRACRRRMRAACAVAAVVLVIVIADADPDKIRAMRWWGCWW